MARADPYADIDFEEIIEQTGLAVDEIKCLKVAFSLFFLVFILYFSFLLRFIIDLFTWFHAWFHI